MEVTKVTVFTGFLGAGKTTILLNLLKQIPPTYKVALLKNEFGDIKVDSELLAEKNQGRGNIEIGEMVNGCFCCVLVGQLRNALLEIKEKFNPDRIFVETSGSAFPAPIAWQIRELNKEFHNIALDAIITVIDCLNFKGFEDVSYSAKMQFKYTDLFLLNKAHLVTERRIEDCLDKIYELNPDARTIKYYGKGNNHQGKDEGKEGKEGKEGEAGENVDPDLIFGLDSKLFLSFNQFQEAEKERMGFSDHHEREVDLIQISSQRKNGTGFQEFDAFLTSLPADNFYRIKGMVQFETGFQLANFAFGRSDWTPLSSFSSRSSIQLTFMGNDLRRFLKKIREALQLEEGEISFHPAHHH